MKNWRLTWFLPRYTSCSVSLTANNTTQSKFVKITRGRLTVEVEK